MALIDGEEEERIYEERVEESKRHLTDDVLRKPVAVLPPAEPIVLRAQDSIRTAVRRMAERKVGSVVIVDAEGRLIGIFTERDLMRKVVDTGADCDSPLRDYMTTPVEAVDKYERIGYVLNRMVIGGYRHVPVVDEARRPVGMLSVRGLLRYLVEHFPEDVLNVPPQPGHETRMLRREGG
jgi:CBS domain-containing protein